MCTAHRAAEALGHDIGIAAARKVVAASAGLDLDAMTRSAVSEARAEARQYEMLCSYYNICYTTLIIAVCRAGAQLGGRVGGYVWLDVHHEADVQSPVDITALLSLLPRQQDLDSSTEGYYAGRCAGMCAAVTAAEAAAIEECVQALGFS